jgi:hypothetical protein
MYKITVTKVDHDSWWGYYINEDFYGYNDYYNFSDDEVKNEGLIRAMEAGHIKHRNEAEVVLQHHTDLPNYSYEADQALMESGDLPATLTEFLQFFADFEG